MKPFFMKTSLILCTLFLWTGISVADTLSFKVGDSRNILNMSQPQQDNEDNVNAVVAWYNSNENNDDLPINLTSLGKYELSENGGGKWEWDIDPGFTGSFIDGGEPKTGDWFANGWNSTYPLYYSLKAGSTQSGGGFELWYTNGLLEGGWNTSGLDNKGLSHISFWTAEGTIPTNPVPEPGTLALVGLGLATLAGYRRKRHSS
jgi:hypothetical protein